MKKILVVLLILAVAGGVFAQQGSWSLGGDVEIGTRIDFDPHPDADNIADDDPARVDGIAYNPYHAMHGALSIGYSRDNIYIGMGFNTIRQTGISVSFDGEAFRGNFKLNNLQGIIDGGTAGNPDVDYLWGEFKFFEGVITLVAAYRNAASEYWVSDKTGTFGGTNYREHGTDADYITGWKRANPFDDGTTFTNNDNWMGNDLLMVNAEFGALNFGVFIPSIFPHAGFWSGDNWSTYEGAAGIYGNTNANLNPPNDDAGAWNFGGNRFVKDVIQKSIIGLSFNQSPFEFAAQFQLAEYGIYFGGKFFAGPITVGLSFTGILDGDGQDVGADADPTLIKIGGKVNYDGEGFGGGIKSFYSRINEGSGSDAYFSNFGVEPYFFYDAIPSHLRFTLDVGFYFLNATDGNDSEKETVWALQPQLFWNFLGTGAGTYYGYNTGIMIRYRLANVDLRDVSYGGENYSANFLDIVFKWGF